MSLLVFFFCSTVRLTIFALQTQIFGADFYCVMGRPGYRVTRRKRCQSKVGKPHRVTKEDSQAWFKQRFDGILTK